MLAKPLWFFETTMNYDYQVQSWLIFIKYILHFLCFVRIPAKILCSCNDCRESLGVLIVFHGLKFQFKNIKSGINETSKYYYLSRFLDYVHLVLKSTDSLWSKSYVDEKIMAAFNSKKSVMVHKHFS